MTAQPALPFWHTKTLEEMTLSEWESLCDGCGRCCLNKLIDPETDAIYTTAVACKLLDTNTCRCKNYADRKRHVSDCIRFTPETIGNYDWLPDSCAYRLLAEGYDLPEWHPLVTGDPESVHDAGFSVRGMAVSEEEVPNPDDWHEYIIRIVEE